MHSNKDFMKLNIWITPKDEKFVKEVIQEVFNLSSKTVDYIYEDKIKRYIDKLKDNCYFLLESPYVDKVYRDSFYNYYSSKLNNYQRDCIRLSIFENKITPEHFRTPDHFDYLKNCYRGFIIFRPTLPFIIGRSVISPSIIKENNFLTCYANISTTANSLKFTVEGFPHSSQDTETISCAETTLWAIMEYFSIKYPEYSSVLPSKLNKVLSSTSSERLVPSRGLAVKQISYALKEFGFGTIIYSRDEYKDNFENILSCYIESGIPLIIAIETPKHITNQYIGHAMLCIGHIQIEEYMIDALPEAFIKSSELSNIVKEKKIKIFDYDNIRKQFIFIDDNYPPYQKAFLNKPTEHYNGAIWPTCEITHFIVPLYTKIYLEAFQAKTFVKSLLLKGPVPIPNDSEIILRTYLCSSRSFKDCLIKNDTFNSDLKEIILELPMPKFIWITEISDKATIKQKKATGIIIIDATEPNTNDYKPLIIAAYQNRLLKTELTKDCLKKDVFYYELKDFSLPLSKFNIFNISLKEIKNAENSK